MTSREWLRIAVAPVAVAVVLAFPGSASAHHTTIECSDQATSTWSITNSEKNTTMSFTTDQGHAGKIVGAGTATVVYAGSSLTVSGVWANGQTNTSTGKGDCVPAPTTSAAPTSTTPTTVFTTPTGCHLFDEQQLCAPEAPPLTPPPATTTVPSYVPQPPPLACIADGVIYPSGTYDPEGTGTFNIDGAPCTPIVPEETVPSTRPTVPPGHLPATGAVTDGLVTLAMLFTIVGVLVLGTTHLPRLLNRRRR